jgi:hypothetical protein
MPILNHRSSKCQQRLVAQLESTRYKTTVVNADINSSAAIAGSKLVMPSGSVLQVKTDALSLAITPSSSSSKILVLVHIGYYKRGSGVASSGYTIMRDSTQIEGTDAYFHYADSNHSNWWYSQNYHVLDSPNTTSSITYKWRFSNSGSDSIGAQAASKMTLMEIAG